MTRNFSEIGSPLVNNSLKLGYNYKALSCVNPAGGRARVHTTYRNSVDDVPSCWTILSASWAFRAWPASAAVRRRPRRTRRTPPPRRWPPWPAQRGSSPPTPRTGNKDDIYLSQKSYDLQLGAMRIKVIHLITRIASCNFGEMCIKIIIATNATSNKYFLNV